jgi:pimeloyl-ACP methyl ester carboxylesterase
LNKHPNNTFNERRAIMNTFVLIHGGCHGAWCWYKIIPRLEQLGHRVIAPDLPSHGRDKTPVSTVTLQSYVDAVCAILDAQREPVVLVGHSMGGGII